jgi:multicomponent Na+:H+ antiporter subunit F
MYLVAAIGVILTMTCALIRALRGPTVFDRILAVAMFNTKTMVLIAVAGFLTGRPEWLDLALLYGLLSFVGVVVVLRFVKYRDLGADGPGAP